LFAPVDGVNNITVTRNVKEIFMNQLTSGSPQVAALAVAVRKRADALGDAAYMAQEDISSDLYRLARDAAELGRVLANIVEGKPLDRAFGAPGDWGYSHPIGKALADAYASAGNVEA
jgi:hypothetical protein